MTAAVRGRSRRVVGRALPAVVAVACGTILADQVAKALAVAFVEDDPIELGVMRLAVTRNPGAAFNLLRGSAWLFLSAVAAVTVVGVVVALRSRGSAVAVGLGLVLGGAWGNAIDRLVRWPGPPNGRVVDFLDFKVWPVFNVADAAIVAGAAVLLVFGGRGRPR